MPDALVVTEAELASLDRYPKGSYWRIVGERPTAYWKSHRLGRIGKVNKKRVMHVSQHSRYVEINLVRLNADDGWGWAKVRGDEIAPATEEEWELQRCLDRLEGPPATS